MSETVCPLCDGTGWKIIERNGLSGATRCTCAITARSASLRKISNIPPNYENASLDTFQIPQENPVARAGLGKVLMDVKRYVRDFPDPERPGLLLVGDTGTGKTHLAVAALRGVMERGHEGLFFDFQNLLDRIRSGYDAASGASDREAYRSAMDADVLLLDDLGSHRVTEWMEDTVTSIITYRCNHQKPLIVTTNLDIDDVGSVNYTTAGGTQVHRKTLGDVIGMRSRSRLHEMCRIVRMPAVEDYRVKRAR
jgi:DNA replication protein DnaC